MKNLKKQLKYVLAVLVCLSVTVTVFAGGNNLYEHYLSQDQDLPSLDERVGVYGEHFSGEYLGTANQNIKLHDYLDYGFTFGTLAQPPSTVEGTSTAGWTDDGSIVRLNTASDFVGIGTTNPAEKLTVTGGNFRLEGSVALITGDIDYLGGDIDIAGGDINLGTGTATTTITSSNGDLGIGTTSPANPNGTTTLAIQGDFFASGTSTADGMVIRGNSFSINSVTSFYPSTEGASSTVLATDGAGNLTPLDVSIVADAMVLLVSTTTAQNLKFATTTVAASKDYRIIFSGAGFSGVEPFSMSFNNDHGASYGWVISENNGTPENDGGSNTFIKFTNSTTSPMYLEINIVGDASVRKFITWQGSVSSSGFQTPKRIEGSAVWNNTSDPITTIVFEIGSAQTILSGTHIRIYGN